MCLPFFDLFGIIESIFVYHARSIPWAFQNSCSKDWQADPTVSGICVVCAEMIKEDHSRRLQRNELEEVII